MPAKPTFLEALLQLIIEMDRSLFQKFNREWTYPLLDPFFSTITDLHKQPWIYFVIFPALALWFYKERWGALRWILALTLTIAATDFFSYRVVKSNIDRARPDQSQIEYTLRSHAHSGRSFPSIHAANMTAGAVILAAAVPTLSAAFYGLAFLVGYSRIYVGVHFPFDVLGGAIIGYLIAKLILKIFGRWLYNENWREYFRNLDKLERQLRSGAGFFLARS